MNSPSFIPATKHDLDACFVLSNLSDEEINPHLPELLEWLQDINWPVAGPVSERLQKVGVQLAPLIIEVLKGEDHIWKYYILSGLLLNCKREVRELCMVEVVRIINSPTRDEVKEEVDLVAKDVLVLHSHGA